MTYQVFDTTLRDGAQREGVTYSVVDKLAVARLLDEFGVGFIEGGWPGAMPKDTEFFRRARSELDLKHALLVAFGATRRADLKADADPQVRAVLDAQTPAVCLVAKSDVRHVERALRTTLEENLAMVRDTVDSSGPKVGGCSWTASTSSTGSALMPRTRLAWRRRRWRPVRRSRSCATPTGGCCRRW